MTRKAPEDAGPCRVSPSRLAMANDEPSNGYTGILCRVSCPVEHKDAIIISVTVNLGGMLLRHCARRCTDRISTYLDHLLLLADIILVVYIALYPC